MTAASADRGLGPILIEVEDLRKLYPLRENLFKALFGRASTRAVHAVDGVSFNIRQGEILGLAGESGSGKTTTGMILAMMERPTSGKVLFEGTDLFRLAGNDRKAFRRKAQTIFQDPYQTLNPRLHVVDTVMEPLEIHRIGRSRRERREKAVAALSTAGLPENLADRYPHELSGGQRQRVAIARAMVLEPKFIVADEPVSMLDVSVRSGVMNVMLRLKRQMGVTFLFISHDLGVTRYMCDRIAIMYLGRIVESGTRDQVISDPHHPYTRVLLSAVPIPQPGAGRKRIRVEGEIPNAVDLPPGCRFGSRCPIAQDICRGVEPNLNPIAGSTTATGADHVVACHFPKEALELEIGIRQAARA